MNTIGHPIGKKAPRGGFALLVTLMIVMAVGMVVTGLVGLTMQENILTMRASAYSRALHAAESGANIASEEFARQIAGQSAWSGWSTSGGTKSLSGMLTNAQGRVYSQYDVSASFSGKQCIITSTGLVSLAGETVQRVVQVTVEEVQPASVAFKYGLMSFGPIHMGGSVWVNSFDSTDSDKSTNGQYDPAKATFNGTIATLSTNNPAITVTGGVNPIGISGMAVIEGSSVSIAHYISYSGDILYDASQDVEDVVIPVSASSSGSVVVGPWPNQAQTITVSGAQDLSLTALTVSQSGNLTITGEGLLRIHVDGNTSITGAGQLRLVPNPSTADLKVELYANGNVNIAGSGVLNNTQRAKNFSIWGTENCTSISVTGNARYVGTIYAPYATVGLTGSSGATGAFLGKQVNFTGASGYIIDESLIGEAPPFSSPQVSGKPHMLLDWREL